MSRPKLTSLAALMPPKGAATRPEPVAEYSDERASQRESEKARSVESNQDSLNTSVESVLRANAISPTKSLRHSSEQASTQEGAQDLSQESEHVSNLDGEFARKIALSSISNDPAEYQDGPRSSVSFRMTERLKERLREYAHRTRRQKQDVLDQAVHEFLRREGY